MNKKGSSMWLWVIIIGLLIAAVIVYGLIKLEVNIAQVIIAMFGGK